ncbi:uncharacterized protein LY79DRAFT_182460 [Colletotrichum navitas]|uniref:Secreted protein n=1 Tax=Colletotrichum navitas TaxID=681940 RepID=A0AAD8Q083_9PEZI|nr:uncharacterized protein LY79DRAFT_182460 [Colletotrichum navitas]KAK1593278.1 hypothetical protein LY79DRAFT_182460 [Colletotrichum navitas]
MRFCGTFFFSLPLAVIGSSSGLFVVNERAGIRIRPLSQGSAAAGALPVHVSKGEEVDSTCDTRVAGHITPHGTPDRDGPRCRSIRMTLPLSSSSSSSLFTYEEKAAGSLLQEGKCIGLKQIGGVGRRRPSRVPPPSLRKDNVVIGITRMGPC